jgi:hypothetical protein
MVNRMRFRSELLQPQPKSNDSEATLTKIYDVYRTPDGHIARDDEASAVKTSEEPPQDR